MTGGPLSVKSRPPGWERVIVCDACGEAACFQGDIMCEKARTAGTCTREEWERRQVQSSAGGIASESRAPQGPNDSRLRTDAPPAAELDVVALHATVLEVMGDPPTRYLVEINASDGTGEVVWITPQMIDCVTWRMLR